MIAGNKEKISPQAKNTTLDSSTNRSGLVIVCSKHHTPMPSSTEGKEHGILAADTVGDQSPERPGNAIDNAVNWMANQALTCPRRQYLVDAIESWRWG